MEKIEGLQIDSLPILKRQGELIYFEGPLLSHWINDKNEHYFYYWVDNNSTHNRWLIFKASNDVLKLFFNKSITLRDIIITNKEVYLIDLNNDIIADNMQIIELINLPELYLPDTRSYYDETFYESYALTLLNSL